jgi:tetratricopeptide (TPR) repeat protein
MAVTTLGHIEYYTGRLERAKQRYEEVLRAARARASHQHATWGLFSIARSLVQQGHFEQARPLLEEATAALAERPEVQSEIICGGLLAYTLLRCGDSTAALALADRTAAQLRKSRPVGFPVLEGYRGVADVYLDVWARGASPAARDGALAMSKSLRRFARVFPIGRPVAELCAGEIDRIEGRTAKAKKRLDRSATQARELGMPRAEALALIARAGLEPIGSTTRLASLEAAHDLCTRLGCLYQLELISSLRRETT